MANRFWVPIPPSNDGSGNINAINHWSDTSGGAGGFSVPTSSDDIIFDSNSFTSGSQTVTMNASISCASFTCIVTNVYFDLSWSSAYVISCGGNVTLNQYINLTGTYGGRFSLSGSGTITPAGETFYDLQTNGGTWDLNGDLICTTAFKPETGTFNSNDYNITCATLDCSSNFVTRVWNFGSSIITITGATLRLSGASTTVTGTYVVKMTSTSSVAVYMTAISTKLNELQILSSTNITLNTSKLSTLKLMNSTNTTGTVVTCIASNIITIDDIIGDGTYNYPIYFKSSVIGTAYTISTEATLSLEKYAISDCTKDGTGSIEANLSVDEGRNTNVTFIDPWIIKKYWVGDSGEFYDPTFSHWSNTSGGPVGTTIPDYRYDAIFDANSFTTTGKIVDFSSSSNSCRDMDWTDALYTPTMKGKTSISQCVNVYGSVTLITDMITTVGSNTVSIVLTSSKADNTFTSAGHTLNTITFTSDTAIYGWVDPTYTLQDNLTCTGSLSHNRGTLITNDKEIWCNSFYSAQNNTRTLTLGSSILNYKSTFDATGSGLTVNAGTSTIKSYCVDLLPTTSSFSSRAYTFNNIEFAGVEDWIIAPYGNSTFNNVKIVIPTGLTGNKKLVVNGSLTGNRGFYVTGNLTGNGTVTNNIELLCSPATSTNSHFISKASGIVSVKYWNISRSNAIGGATFYADLSTDSGDNTGWIFGPAPGFKMYWGDKPVTKVMLGSIDVTKIYFGDKIV